MNAPTVLEHHVLIATPSLSGTPTAEYMQSLLLTQQVCAQYGIVCDLTVLRGDCFIDKARNHLVMQFLESPATSLFFIDDDEGWDPNGFVRMVLDEHDIVAGAVPKKSEPLEFNGLVLDVLENGDCVIENSLLKAHRIGTGFMRIKRGAIERMIEAYPERYRPGDGSKYESLYNLFEAGPIDGQFWGEDLFFCHKWGKIGGAIWIDTQIDFKHVGRKVYEGNYFKFLQANCQITATPLALPDGDAAPVLTIVDDFSESVA